MSDKTEVDIPADSLDWIQGNNDTAVDSDAADEKISGEIILTGSLGIAAAESMHRKLCSILQAQVDISIESEDLSRVDAAGTQLIYAFIKELSTRNIPLKWISVSDALHQAADTLGLTEGMHFETTGA